MPLDLLVPPVGESISEVQIGEWLKSEGQSVRKDETLVQLESEKATIDLPSPASGTLVRILRARGDVARVGEAIAVIDESGGAPVDAPALERPAAAVPAPPALPGPTKIVMPSAQRILAAAGIDPMAVQGTGVAGRITKIDALQAVPQGARQAEGLPTPPPAPAAGPTAPGASFPALPVAVPPVNAGEEIVPLSPLRRTVARRLVEAQNTMAMLTTFNEVDMSAVILLRKTHQEAFTARHGVKLGFMSFFVKAAIDALKQFPQLNAEIREQSVVYHQRFDIGVAIGGGKGLVVPVLRAADRLGFAEIEKAISDLGARARDGRIRPEELHGGTFTITNGGIYGSMLSTPIINPPQTGILGMHAIQDRPVVVAGQIVVRPIMYLALTYDHRIVDGREAVTFLKRLKDAIEDPVRMLVEV